MENSMSACYLISDCRLSGRESTLIEQYYLEWVKFVEPKPYYLLTTPASSAATPCRRWKVQEGARRVVCVVQMCAFLSGPADFPCLTSSKVCVCSVGSLEKVGESLSGVAIEV